MPELKDKAKDKHGLRESSGAQLWGVRAKKVTRDITVAKAIERPHSGLHRKAQKVWNERQLPKPIEHSTKLFDDKLTARQQEAREAFRTVSKEPNLTTDREFGTKVRELSRVRFTLVAPVAHRAEAYPDAVWGIQLDRMGGSNYDRQGNKASGMSFSGPPNKPGSPRPIPMLPAMPGMDKSDEHMLLPDSHFALGSFSNRKQSSSSEGKFTPIGSSKRVTPISKFAGPGGLKKLGKLSMLSGMLGKAAKEYSTNGERQGCPRPGGSGGDWELYRWQLSQLRADNSYRPSKEGVGIGPDGVPYVNSAKVWAMTEAAVALVEVADRLAVAVVQAPMLVDSILTAQAKVDQKVALDLLPAQMDMVVVVVAVVVAWAEARVEARAKARVELRAGARAETRVEVQVEMQIESRMEAQAEVRAEALEEALEEVHEEMQEQVQAQD
eukprot:jgi/Chrpa1/19548/Chrysochromulina_OHIO_Genome00024380-RA